MLLLQNCNKNTMLHLLTTRASQLNTQLSYEMKREKEDIVVYCSEQYDLLLVCYFHMTLQFLFILEHNKSILLLRNIQGDNKWFVLCLPYLNSHYIHLDSI